MPEGYRNRRDERETRVIVPGEATMPQDLAAERSVLSAMLLSQDVLQEALIEMNERDFYLHANRTIFSAMHSMFDKSLPVDPVSLADYLRTEGELERIGGMSYLLELNNNTLSLANWHHHAEMLRRDATLREIIAASARITALAFDAPEDTKEVVDSAERMILSVTDRDIRSNYSTLEEVMGELYEELAEQAINPSAMGVMTGFNGIDARLQGLRPGQMIVIGARPGVGKTSFALNLAINAAAKGASVAFFSLEMSKTEIAQRLLSAQARIPLSAIRGARIQDSQWPALLEATNDLSRLDIMIDDTPGTTVTEVSEMSRGIKIMAKDLGVPVISLSQLSRQVESRTGKRPQLSDLRESGSIEQDADIVILLDRSMTSEEAERQDRPDENVTDFIIAKNRSGPLDIVPLMFLPGSTKFVEVDTFHD